MSALRRAGVWLGLVEEDATYEDEYRRPSTSRRYRDNDEYNDDYVDEYSDELEFDDVEESTPDRSVRTQQRPRTSAEPSRASVSPITAASSARTSPVRDVAGFSAADNLALTPHAVTQEYDSTQERVQEEETGVNYRITTLHPSTYNEARTIGEHFRENTPVIINLTEMDESDAKRLVDFAAGLAFGLRGSIERVTNRVFLLSPASVSVTAEDRARIAEGGFFNQS